MKNSIKAISAVLVFAILALSLLSVTSSAAFVTTTSDNFELTDWIVDNNNQNTVTYDIRFSIDGDLQLILAAQSASSLYRTKTILKLWDLGEYESSYSWYYNNFSIITDKTLVFSESDGFANSAGINDTLESDYENLTLEGHVFYFSATIFSANNDLSNIRSQTVTGLIVPDGNLFEATFYVKVV